MQKALQEPLNQLAVVVVHRGVLQLVLLLGVEDEALALDKRLQRGEPHGRGQKADHAEGGGGCQVQEKGSDSQWRRRFEVEDNVARHG